MGFPAAEAVEAAEAAGKILMMKNFIHIIALFFCVFVFAQNVTVALPVESEDFIENTQEEVQRERIVSFSSDIHIAENTHVTVTETIKVMLLAMKSKEGFFVHYLLLEISTEERKKLSTILLLLRKTAVQNHIIKKPKTEFLPFI